MVTKLFSIGAAVALLIGLSAVAADRPADPPDPAALVRQLGSSVFAQRQAAEKQLLALGPAALPAVAAGVASPDPEVARRCRELGRRIRAAQGKAFVAGKAEAPFAAWPRFKEVGGDSPEARKLFAAMMADDQWAADIDRAAGDPSKAHEVYAAAIGRVRQAADGALKPFLGMPVDLNNDAAPTAL